MDFVFEPQPGTAAWVKKELDALVAGSPWLVQFSARLLEETSTRLIDWVDRIGLVECDLNELGRLGWKPSAERPSLWTHAGGMFPVVEAQGAGKSTLFLRVEDVEDFARCHGLTAQVEGAPLAPTRRLLVKAEPNLDIVVVERHAGRLVDDFECRDAELVTAHRHAFAERRRNFTDEAEGFTHALQLIEAARRDLGAAYASDLFFHAERDYWQSRNAAGRLQKARQDRLGLGWANHDHHTYRSSREHFHALIAALEALGMSARERFYAGAEAGWGAQVLEHPDTGTMVFADVDLEPDEVMGDFAHQLYDARFPHAGGLAPRDRLGTVGLWCKLHGEAFLQAGMHHLEAQFDFDEARRWFEHQSAAPGVDTSSDVPSVPNGKAVMAPFTDFPYLRQCFTRGETWAVAQARIEAAVAAGWITEEQAAGFLRDGAIGSHLEILERNQGYKGFNQTGISKIITETDPRRIAVAP